MTDFVKKALTRRNANKKELNDSLEPDERLVLGVKFTIASIFCLSSIEIANLAVLGIWNSKVFASITGLTASQPNKNMPFL